MLPHFRVSMASCSEWSIEGSHANCRHVVPVLVKKAAVSNTIAFHNDSRARLQNGINKVADAVGVTLGPRGEMDAPRL